MHEDVFLRDSFPSDFMRWGDGIRLFFLVLGFGSLFHPHTNLISTYGTTCRGMPHLRPDICVDRIHK